MLKKDLLADFVILKNTSLKQGVDTIRDNTTLKTVKEGKLFIVQQTYKPFFMTIIAAYHTKNSIYFQSADKL
ncbi:MAG: hypothetical protein V5789_14340 [Colwellia sp.]